MPSGARKFYFPKLPYIYAGTQKTRHGGGFNVNAYLNLLSLSPNLSPRLKLMLSAGGRFVSSLGARGPRGARSSRSVRAGASSVSLMERDTRFSAGLKSSTFAF